MSESLHRHVSGSAIGAKKISLIPGRVNKFTILKDRGCAVYFALRKKEGGDAMAGQAFILTGQGVRIQDRTDLRGMFRHAPLQAGDYELEINKKKYTVPARSSDEPAYEIIIPSAEEKS